MQKPSPETTAKYAGFSSPELLRRARVLREIAEREAPRERNRLERLALEHEDAARDIRIQLAKDMGIA